MKKIKLCIAVTLCILCGCAKGQREAADDTGAADTGTSSMSDASQEHTGSTEEQSEGKRVTIDFNLEEIDISDIDFYTTKAYVKTIDYEGIAREICGEFEEMEDRENEYLSGSEDSVYWRIFFDTEHLNIMRLDDFYKYNKAFRDGIWGDIPNAELYKDKLDFEFGTAEESLKKIDAFFAGYGIDTEEFAIDTYYVSADKMKENESYIQMDSDELIYENRYEWGKDDDMYAFYFGQRYCGLPVYATFGGYMRNVNECDTAIKVLYNKDGIAEMSSTIIGFEPGGEKVALMDVTELVKNVAKVYEMIIDDNTYTIQDYKLICDVDKKGMTRPVWVFEIDEAYSTENGMGHFTSYRRYDAETGKQIVEVGNAE